jgi:lipopolysaccharide transport system ATP-binding protein
MQPSDILRKQHLDTPLAGGSGSVVESEILVDVQHVSKKFCRDLKKSLWYGLKDVFTEMNPWQPRSAALPAAPSGNDLRPAEFWAVNDVSFQLRRGECLGLIGHNGAGKTTLLKMLNGLIKPDSGSITMRGRVGALIALGAGFNPILTGRENVYINGAILGLSKKEIDDQIDSIIDFAEIREFIDSPVQSYSSGMQVRLGFAVATAMKPDVLILDEVLAVG